MSYGEFYWLTKRILIPYKDFGRGLDISPIWNPMSILIISLLAMRMTGSAVAGLRTPPPRSG